MAEKKPSPPHSEAVKTLVDGLVNQLQETAAAENEQKSQLKAFVRKAKDPEIRKAVDATIKQHAAAVADAKALAKNLHSATNPMVADLDRLIEVATRPF